MNSYKLSFIFCHFLVAIWYNIGIVKGIVGGDYATDNQFKYQVSIQANKAHRCGGAIISNRHVLTAAHCVVDKENKFCQFKYTVVAGVIDTKLESPNKVEVGVEKIYVPAVYQFVDYFASDTAFTIGDIAVLELISELALGVNPAIDKVKFPNPSDTYSVFVQRKPIITGFGFTSVTMSKDWRGRDIVKFRPKVQKLKFIKTNVISNDRCQMMYPTPIHYTHLCAQATPQDTQPIAGICMGDSGGPLVLSGNKILGVLVEGPRFCNEIRRAGIYTNVLHFMSFIQKAINNQNSSDIRVANVEIQSKCLINTCGMKMVIIESSNNSSSESMQHQSAEASSMTQTGPARIGSQ